MGSLSSPHYVIGRLGTQENQSPTKKEYNEITFGNAKVQAETKVSIYLMAHKTARGEKPDSRAGRRGCG